jgi:hypothetical protein
MMRGLSSKKQRADHGNLIRGFAALACAERDGVKFYGSFRTCEAQALSALHYIKLEPVDMDLLRTLKRSGRPGPIMIAGEVTERYTG